MFVCCIHTLHCKKKIECILINKLKVVWLAIAFSRNVASLGRKIAFVGRENVKNIQLAV